MTAADPEGRVRHLLDVMHKTYDDAGDPIAAGMVPVADGLGQVDYVDSSTFGGGGLPWFNVMDAIYGAVNDGTTDDTTAINAAIAALNTATKGVLYFPAGTGYKVTGALTTITASGTILGDGVGAYTSTGSAVFETSSRINLTSATAVLFTLTGGMVVRDISLVNTAGGTPSAGAAIQVSGSDARQHVILERVFVDRFFNGVDVQTNSAFTMVACSIWNPQNYGVKLRNTVNTDNGGAAIIGCTILSETQGAVAGIRIESSGGNKIVSTNIVNIGTYAISLVAAADSSILLVSACSIEGYTGDAIHLDANGHDYRLINVIGCEFGQFSNGTGHVFYSTGVTDIVVTDCVLRSNTGTPTAISLNSGTRAMIGPFTNDGFSVLLASSSFTSIDDRTTASSVSYATPAIVLGTAAAAGAASTVIRSDSTIVAFDATVPVTQAFGDAAATGSATVASRRDHVHGMPATPSTNSQHILLADGRATPFAFTDLLQMDDGSDFMWSDP
jgi:hypothetical protein